MAVSSSRNKQDLIVAVMALLLVVSSLPARSEVQITNPWMRLLPPVSKMTAAYMSLKSDRDDRLLSVSSEVAEVIEIHRSTMQEGVMRMEQVWCLSLPENQPVELKPQSYHLMVMGLRQPLKEGDTYRFVLTFEQAGSIELMVPVKRE